MLMKGHVMRGYDRTDQRTRRTLWPVAARVMAAMLGVSASTIVAFALLYRLVDALTPHWGFLAVGAEDTPVQSLGEILTFSMYVFFHIGGPALLTAHGPERVLVGVELGASWGWLVLLGARTVDEVRRCRQD